MTTIVLDAGLQLAPVLWGVLTLCGLSGLAVLALAYQATRAATGYRFLFPAAELNEHAVPSAVRSDLVIRAERTPWVKRPAVLDTARPSGRKVGLASVPDTDDLEAA